MNPAVAAAEPPSRGQRASSNEPTLADLVREGTEVLGRAGIDRAAAEARDLVSAVLDRPRFWPLLHPGARPAALEAAAIRRATCRRAAGAPFAYAVGRASFRFLTLHVDERVLIPRPETERLVELVLATPQARAGGVAVDVGTGSGAIALALASEGRFDRVIATDLSQDALAVAQLNAREHAASLRATIEFRPGAGLAPLARERADVLVSNPPYIAWQEVAALPRLVRDWEPSPALCCDDDGLAVTRELVAGAPSVLREGGLLALEVDARRARLVAAMLDASLAFGGVTIVQDYAGRERFVFATRSDHPHRQQV